MSRWIFNILLFCFAAASNQGKTIKKIEIKKWAKNHFLEPLEANGLPNGKKPLANDIID